MTDLNTDLLTMEPEPVAIPDFRATSGESGNGKPNPIERLRTAGNKRSRVEPQPKESKPVPKLGPHMKQKIQDFYVLVGGMVRPFDELLGDTIIEQAPLCAKSVYDYAQENEAFRRIIQGFLTTSMTGALIFAHLPIVLVLVSKSKNERARMGAAGMMVAMKMMDQNTADEVFAGIGDEQE